MIPAELMLGALDGPWFHHCQTLTQSDLMLSVRAPDDSPLRQVLWQDQFDFACLPKPGCIEIHPWRFIRRVAMACNSREPWRKTAFVFKFDIFRNQGCSKVGRGMGTNESRSCCIVVQIVNHKLAYYIRWPYLDSNQQRKDLQFIDWMVRFRQEFFKERLREVCTEEGNDFPTWVH